MHTAISAAEPEVPYGQALTRFDRHSVGPRWQKLEAFRVISISHYTVTTLRSRRPCQVPLVHTASDHDAFDRSTITTDKELMLTHHDTESLDSDATCAAPNASDLARSRG